MNIKAASQATGLSADTIRYYERIGLLPPVTRTRSGIRDFTERDLRILEFVSYFRKSGMGVEALVDYMSLVQEGEDNIPARLAILEEERERLEAKLAQLTQALERLNFKIDNYQSKIVPKEQQLFGQIED